MDPIQDRDPGSGSRSGSQSGIGSISQGQGSADLDPPQNVMDPQHWFKECHGTMVQLIVMHRQLSRRFCIVWPLLLKEIYKKSQLSASSVGRDIPPTIDKDLTHALYFVCLLHSSFFLSDDIYIKMYFKTYFYCFCIYKRLLWAHDANLIFSWLKLFCSTFLKIKKSLFGLAE